MKIAIFQSFMDNIGGAEIVSLNLAKELDADIYTTNIDFSKMKKMGFSNIKIKSIGNVDNVESGGKQVLQKFKKLKLNKKYDAYIIGGEYAISAAVNHKPNIWYTHSLIKEAFDRYEYIKKTFFRGISRPIFEFRAYYQRYLTKLYIRHINSILCNSINTQKKIKHYLNKNATVVYPPIDTKKFRYIKNGNFWLSVNRLYYTKRVEMQIKAFKELPEEKLIIVGSYEKSKYFEDYAKYIQKIKPKNVKIISWIDFIKLQNLYANCKGFITTAMDEDFGITPVEAMASGKPVIAPNEGGYKETVINKKTGILIDNINENKIVKAMKEIGKNPKKYKKDCIKQAKKFDTKVFIRKIKEEIK